MSSRSQVLKKRENYKKLKGRNGSIICFQKRKTDSHLWDARWSDFDFETKIPAVERKKKRPIVKSTLEMLRQGARVIEGGCGYGSYVYLLNELNYNVVGVDYAEKTVQKVNEIFPELDIVYGDLNNLNFPDNHFDGYWSLGVIEHDINGFSQMRSEMYRVLKSGGILFLTFPYVNL